LSGGIFFKRKREKERYKITQAGAPSRFAEQSVGLDLDRESLCYHPRPLFSFLLKIWLVYNDL
jgi:hypothetical protein